MELPGIETANAYTLSTIGQRLAALNADPWEGYSSTRQSISAETLTKLESG